jgi:hypothetical protein
MYPLVTADLLVKPGWMKRGSLPSQSQSHHVDSWVGPSLSRTVRVVAADCCRETIRFGNPSVRVRLHQRDPIGVFQEMADRRGPKATGCQGSVAQASLL